MDKITFQKNYAFYLVTLILFAINNVWAQEPWCIVHDDLTVSERAALGISEQEFLANKIHVTNSQATLSVPSNYTITPKKFRINIFTHQGKSTETVNNISYDDAVRFIKDLNALFEPMQICFVLNRFEKFRSGLIKDGSYHTDDPLPTDAINVFIYVALGGGAHGIATHKKTILLKESAIENENALLAHEMGHILGLHHTHGRFNRPSSGYCDGFTEYNTACEHVTRDPNDPNYNATTEGDLVYDTAADPGLFANNSVDYPNCKNLDSAGNYIGNQVDCQGTPYAIDNSVLSNIMSYNYDVKKVLFTQGQAERIHYIIDSSTFPLKQALVTPSDINGFDLMVRNSHDDMGYEPDTVSTIFWNSPDIWVRNINDTIPWHENPVYGIGNNYVKVRVVNRGCAPSDGTGKLKLYWTKAGTNLPMQVWDGSISLNGVPMGGMIGEANLPVLNSYEEHIFTFPWPVPNPDDFSAIDEPWHFCLLAKIETPDDVSALPEHNGIYYHFLNSNNIALHNVSVIPVEETTSGQIYIGNFEPIGRNFSLKLSRDLYNFPNTNIFDEAEVKIEFDTKLWGIWQESGFAGSGYTVYGDKTVIVNEHTEIIINNFPANDYGIANVRVNFLIPGYTPNTDFGFNVEHWNSDTNQLMGGELYLVHKNERDLFSADGYLSGASLKAVPVNEPAEYNWYDSNGNLVHTGQTYNLTNSNGTYLLEVISDYDGFKDYKKINVAAVSVLKNMYPNPAGSSVTIEYKPLSCNTAYIMLVNINNSSTTNHILDLNEDHITIDTSQLPAGLYRVVLVCDNNVMESDNLIIQ